MPDEDFARAVRSAAAQAQAQGDQWGVVTHEDPFGNRSIEIGPIGAVWEKHGVDAKGVCRTCMLRQMATTDEPMEGLHIDIALSRMHPDQDADVLVRPLAEALREGS
jgi:hypothetical protein